jgi:immunoglobulin-binding protein 1
MMGDQSSIENTRANEPLSLLDALYKVESIFLHGEGGSFEDSIVGLAMLEKLQERIHTDAIFSSNEYLDDVTTSSLPLLKTEFLLGKAYLQLPTKSSTERKIHVFKALDSYHSFLRRCELLEGILNDEVKKDYYDLLELDKTNDRNDSGDGDTIHSSSVGSTKLSATFGREKKIARFRLTKSLNTQKDTIKALQNRRSRLGLSEGEELEGYDSEGLERALYLSELNIHACESIEEIDSCIKEIEILPVAIQMEECRKGMVHHNDSADTYVTDQSARLRGATGSNSIHKAPLEVTRVSTDPITGQLIMRREKVRSTVFRPGWIQPTMTLDQFAQLELADAMARSERQSAIENSDDILRPKRYEQLVKEGKEDDGALVDLSADVDRKWDDWKDENPKGSGNKLGDRGDRNF